MARLIIWQTCLQINNRIKMQRGIVYSERLFFFFGDGGWHRRNDGQLSGVIGEQQCMWWFQIDVGVGSSPKAVNMLSGRREIN